MTSPASLVCIGVSLWFVPEEMKLAERQSKLRCNVLIVRVMLMWLTTLWMIRRDDHLLALFLFLHLSRGTTLMLERKQSCKYLSCSRYSALRDPVTVDCWKIDWLNRTRIGDVNQDETIEQGGLNQNAGSWYLKMKCRFWRLTRRLQHFNGKNKCEHLLGM